jgi:hypothetical protein
MLYEIRNYHIRPDSFAAYKQWAKSVAIPHLATKLDLVGFWINTADAAEVRGEAQDARGAANVTWILRWPDKATRDATMATAFVGPEWEAVFAQLPGGFDNYLRTEAKFAEALV